MTEFSVLVELIL